GKWVMVPLGPETAFPVEVSYWSLSNPGGPNWRNAPFGSTNWPVIVDWKPAPGAWPKCGDSPSVEIVEDCEGNVTVTVNAGNTRRTWRVDGKDEILDVGETGVWTAGSIDALVEWFHENSKEWKQADESYVTSTPAEDCPEETNPPEDEPE